MRRRVSSFRGEGRTVSRKKEWNTAEKILIGGLVFLIFLIILVGIDSLILQKESGNHIRENTIVYTLHYDAEEFDSYPKEYVGTHSYGDEEVVETKLIGDNLIEYRAHYGDYVYSNLFQVNAQYFKIELSIEFTQIENDALEDLSYKIYIVENVDPESDWGSILWEMIFVAHPSESVWDPPSDSQSKGDLPAFLDWIKYEAPEIRTHRTGLKNRKFTETIEIQTTWSKGLYCLTVSPQDDVKSWKAKIYNVDNVLDFNGFEWLDL